MSYLGLTSHESYPLALKLLRPKAFGGVLSFGVKGDVAAASKVVDNLKLASNLANVGELAISVFPSIVFNAGRIEWDYRRRENTGDPPCDNDSCTAYGGGTAFIWCHA